MFLVVPGIIFVLNVFLLEMKITGAVANVAENTKNVFAGKPWLSFGKGLFAHVAVLKKSSRSREKVFYQF